MRDPRSLIFPEPLRHREDLVLAVDLALQAGAIVQRVAAEGFDAIQKGDQGPVTRADTEADAHIKAGLMRAFPAHGILTEEGGGDAVGREQVWVVDPLDGTKAFVKRIPGYSVMIGRLDDGQPALGVVYDPLQDWLFAGGKGLGAWIWAPSSSIATPPQLPEPHERAYRTLVSTNSATDQDLAPWMRAGGFDDVLRINSVGVKVGLLLAGRGAVYHSLHGLSYWDTVAPVALAEAAGLIAVAHDGSPLDYVMDLDCAKHSQLWTHPLPVLVGAPERVREMIEIV